MENEKLRIDLPLHIHQYRRYGKSDKERCGCGNFRLIRDIEYRVYYDGKPIARFKSEQSAVRCIADFTRGHSRAHAIKYTYREITFTPSGDIVSVSKTYARPMGVVK